MARLQLQDHLVLISGGKDRGNLPRRIGAGESVFNLLGGNPQERSFVAVDLDIDLGVFDLQVRGHILQPGDLPEPLLQDGSITVEGIRIRGLQGELILAFRHAPADPDGRRVLQKNLDPRNGSQFRPELLNDFVRAQITFISRFQTDIEPSGVGSRAAPAWPYGGHECMQRWDLAR